MGAMLAKRLIALLLAACAPAPAPVVEEQTAAAIEVFFSDPQRVDARSHRQRGGPAAALEDALAKYAGRLAGGGTAGSG